MTCYYPRPAWVEKEPNKNGRKQITFAKKGSQIEEDLMIPCGKCLGCQASARMDWSIRMYHEAQDHERNCFLTLTYENPPDRLEVKHLQKFMRRLKNLSSEPIRYFAVGEYGKKTNRPHYHAILFGEDFMGGAYTINDQLYGNAIIDGTWERGQCALAPFNMSTSCYVAGYVNKKIGDKDTFNVMSKRPPIGYNYAVKWQDQLARTEKVIIEGDEYPIPKKYLEWHKPSNFRPTPIDLDTVRGNRKKYLVQRTPQELRNKETNVKKNQNFKDHKI